MYGYDHYANNNSTFAFLEHLAPSDYFDIKSSENTSSPNDLWRNKYQENNDCRDLDVKTHLLLCFDVMIGSLCEIRLR